MNTIGQRIQAERERLGMDQTAFGAAGGVKRGTQSRYETQGRIPDAEYLAGIASVGADVGFILTGYHTPPRPDSPEVLQFHPVATRVVPFLEVLTALDDEALAFVQGVAARELARQTPKVT